MNRTTAPKIFLLFARTAVRRMLNRSSRIKWGRVQPGETVSETAAAPRTGTTHRSNQSSWISRMIRAWFPVMAVLGMIGLSTNTLFVSIDSLLLRENRTAAVLTVSPSFYEDLQQAARQSDEAARKEELSKVFASAFSSPAAWIQEESVQIALNRYDAQGLAAFRPLPSETPYSGTFAYLSPEGRRLACQVAGAFVAMFAFLMLCMGFGLLGSLSGTDPALTWLWQFPVSRRVLFSARLIEYTADTPIVLAITYFQALILWLNGWSALGGAAAALLLGVATAFSAAAIRLTVENILAARVGRQTRGFFVATATATGSMLLLLIMLGSNTRFVVEPLVSAAAALPALVFSNPLSGGLGTAAMTGGHSLAMVLPPVAVAGLMATGAVLLAVRMTRSGLVSGGESSRLDEKTSTGFAATQGGTTGSTAIDPAGRQSRFGVLVRKELLQMRRRPELLGQLLTAPLMIAALAYLGGHQKAMEWATRSGSNISVALLVGGIYVLMVAASQAMACELKWLWLLQCQPRPLADVVRSKARVWGSITIAMSVPFLVGACFLVPAEADRILMRGPFLFAALWWLAEVVFGLTALGATVTNETTVRFRKGALVVPGLVMADASLAIASDNWWMEVRVAATLAILAAAVRQRALAELNWLSEPIETPPRRIDAIHGLVALIAFETLMGVFGSTLPRIPDVSATVSAAAAYCLSAALVSLGFWIWLRENRLSVSALAPARPLPERRAVLRPLLAGITVSCIAGAAVLTGLKWLDLSSPVTAQLTRGGTLEGPHDKWWLFLLFVIAAPLFEEWLFRGVLYRTMRRSWSVGLSVALSALLFATLHPVVACFSLMTLGVMTALTAERTGRLWPSIATHATYNLMVWFAVVNWA